MLIIFLCSRDDTSTTKADQMSAVIDLTFYRWEANNREKNKLYILYRFLHWKVISAMEKKKQSREEVGRRRGM